MVTSLPIMKAVGPLNGLSCTGLASLVISTPTMSHPGPHHGSGCRMLSLYFWRHTIYELSYPLLAKIIRNLHTSTHIRSCLSLSLINHRQSAVRNQTCASMT